MAVWFNCYHAVYSSIPHLGLLFEIYIQLLWLVFKSKAYCRSLDFNENYFSRCNFRTSKGGSDWTGQIRDQKAITRLYCFLFFWFPSSCELVCWKDTQPSIARLSEQAVKRSQHSLLILLTISDIIPEINTSSLSWLSKSMHLHCPSIPWIVLHKRWLAADGDLEGLRKQFTAVKEKSFNLEDAWRLKKGKPIFSNHGEVELN